MEKIDLNGIGEELITNGPDLRLYYNRETGKFDHHLYSLDNEDEDSEGFEESYWMAAPDSYEKDEYATMVSFAANVADRRANELLRVALEGKGAFSRFRNTLYRVGLEKEWYAFKHKALVEIAREWCEDNGIPYEETAEGHSRCSE